MFTVCDFLPIFTSGNFAIIDCHTMNELMVGFVNRIPFDKTDIPEDIADRVVSYWDVATRRTDDPDYPIYTVTEAVAHIYVE